MEKCEFVSERDDEEEEEEVEEVERTRVERWRGNGIEGRED